MENGRNQIGYEFTEQSEMERDAAIVQRVRDGIVAGNALIHNLIGGYSVLRSRAVEKQNWNEVAYYDGKIAGLQEAHRHLLELMG